MGHQQKPSIHLHLDNYKRPSDGKSKFWIRVSIAGEKQYYPTDTIGDSEVYMERKYWINEIEPESGRVLRKKRIQHSKGNPDSRKIERSLANKLEEMDRLITDLIKADKSISHDLLKRMWVRKNSLQFSDWMGKWYEKWSVDRNHKKGTIKSNQELIKNVQQFESFHGPKNLGQITVDWLSEFQAWALRPAEKTKKGIITGKGFSQWNGVQKVKCLGIFIKGAYVAGEISTNVYRDFIDRGMLERREDKIGAFLDPSEIKRLEDAYHNEEMYDFRRMMNGEPNPIGKHRHNALAIFLFLIYTGLRYSDLVKVAERHPDVSFSETHLTVVMSKTRKPIRLKITSKMRSVTNLSSVGPVFEIPVGGCGTANLRLKKILKMVGIEKDPKLHGLRRTFACYLLSQGARMKVVSQLLGHQSITVTEKHYAKLVNLSLDEGMDFFEKRGPKPEQDKGENTIMALRTLLRDNPDPKFIARIQELINEHLPIVKKDRIEPKETFTQRLIIA